MPQAVAPPLENTILRPICTGECRINLLFHSILVLLLKVLIIIILIFIHVAGFCSSFGKVNVLPTCAPTTVDDVVGVDCLHVVRVFLFCTAC